MFYFQTEVCTSLRSYRARVLLSLNHNTACREKTNYELLSNS